MPERDGYISGVPCWIDTGHPDPEAAVPFYSDLFGWELENVMPAESGAKYFIARVRGGDVAALGPRPEGGPPAAMWNTYVAVDSADETASRVSDAGGRVVSEPFDVQDAGRMAVFMDPEGAAFCVWQANRHKGARIVNEHGSLNFNTLNTRDPEISKAFYGAVFGWELELADGAGFWRLPGYGDYLEERSPGLRKGMAETGAPAGFEDVVAALNPIADDQPEVPAHWSVTFAVDDADAIASRAAELGGSVVSGPFDAPWVRMAVIADPQGATFIASKFAPENRDLASPAGSAGAAA
jgi:predicted enzyme related to lactoylglutathione lyase